MFNIQHYNQVQASRTVHMYNCERGGPVINKWPQFGDGGDTWIGAKRDRLNIFTVQLKRRVSYNLNLYGKWKATFPHFEAVRRDESGVAIGGGGTQQAEPHPYIQPWDRRLLSARRCLEGTDRADVLDRAERRISREMGVLDNKHVNLNSYENYSSKIFETKTRKMNFLLNPTDVNDVKPEGILKSTKLFVQQQPRIRSV